MIVLMALLAALGAMCYAAPKWAEVLMRLLSDGGLALAWLAAAVGLGDVLLGLSRIDFDETPATLRVATAGATGLGAYSLLILGLGLLGFLNGAAAWLCLGAGWGCAIYRVWRLARSGAWLAMPAGTAWPTLIAAPFLAMSLVAATVPPGMLWQPEDPHGYDVVEYHLQAPREWFEAGRIVPLHHNAYAYFPFNVEMHYLLAMHLRGGPWAGMYLAQFMHLGFMILAVLAVHGVSARLGSERGAILAALVLAVTPWTAQLGSVAYDEGGMILFGALAVGWALVAMQSSGQSYRSWAVAGAMAGFAAGCKFTAVPEVLVAAPVVCGIVGAWGWMTLRSRAASVVGPPNSGAAASAEALLQRGDLRSVLPRPVRRERVGVRVFPSTRREEPSPQPSPGVPGEGANAGAPQAVASAPTTPASPVATWSLVAASPAARPARLALGLCIFCLAGGLMFLPWLARNYAWTGNPVFPEAMPLLGAGDFSQAQVQRWELAHKAVPSQQTLSARAAALWKEVVLGWQYGYIVPIGMIAAALAWRRPAVWVLMGMLLALTLFWLFFTHLQGRFFILAVPFVALLVGQAPWNRWSWPAAIAVIVIVGSVGLWRIHVRLYDKLYGQHFIEALGVDDFSWMAHGNRLLKELPADVHIYLVGDSRAFWYDVPMSRLHYRTAFDVRDSEDFLKGWIGSETPPPGSQILIDPNEVKRLTNSYWKLPPIPKNELAHLTPHWR